MLFEVLRRETNSKAGADAAASATARPAVQEGARRLRGDTERDRVTGTAATDGRTDGKEKERRRSEGGEEAGTPSLLRPVVVLGARPAPPSIALRKMEREEKKEGWGG